MRCVAKQKGLGLMDLILWSVVLVVLAIVGMRLVPAYLESRTVQKIFVSIASDPKLKKAKLPEIQAAFQKQTLVDHIETVKADQIEADWVDGKLVVSASYEVRSRLAGNIYILMEFKPTSAESQ